MAILQEELKHNSWLVSVSGRLDQTQTPDLEECLNALLDQGRHRIVVDLANVNYINSGGLRCLVTAWRKANRSGGNVVLTGLRSRVYDVFSMVGFDKVFDVYPDHARAADSWHEEK